MSTEAIPSHTAFSVSFAVIRPAAAMTRPTIAALSSNNTTRSEGSFDSLMVLRKVRPRSLPIELLQGRTERDQTFEQRRYSENGEREPEALTTVAVWVPDLPNTGDDRQHRAAHEEEHGDHEAPEVDLLAASVGVLHAGVEARRCVPSQQKQLIA